MPYVSTKSGESRNMFGYEEDPYDIEKDWRRPDQGQTPLSSRRRTTDMTCLILFIGCLGFLVCSILYASFQGSLSSYFGFTDYQGNICGSSVAEAHRPYLFMCRDTAGGLDANRPICAAECPSADTAQNICAGVDNYPTQVYAGKLCMPLDPALKKIVRMKIAAEPGTKFVLNVTEIIEDTWPIAIATVTAVLLGFLQLFLLRRFGICFVWIGFIAMIGVPLILGITLITQSSLGEVIVFGDEQNAHMAGICMCLLALFLSCLVACSYKDMLTARTTTKAAVECILDTMGLLAEPFIALFIRSFIFFALAIGFLLLSSSEGWHWEGLRFNGPLPLFMALYILASLWILEVCSALSQYVAAVVTEEWFFATYNAVLFSKEVDPKVMRNAYYGGVRYHLGTLAYGAAILPVIRGPRALLFFLAQASRRTDTPVGGCINSVCNCVVEFYYKRIECLNRSAYFEVALNSLPFQPAAVHAMQVLSDDASSVLSMHGAAWLIELGGAGGITAVCVGLTHFLCMTFVPFADEMSPYHVANPILIDIVTACICYPVASLFLLVVVHVSDCILFCCALERARNPVRTAFEDVGTGLLSRFNVCTNRSKEGASWAEDTNQLPNTRALLNMVRKDRAEMDAKPKGCMSQCASRESA